jgi:histidine triad (HIT) family protein
MILVANELARQTGIAEKGFRVVINVGSEGGQVVPHLHVHLLGGRRMSEKMG